MIFQKYKNIFYLATGASSNPCSETFAGPRAWSEPETEQLADYLRNLTSEVKVYLSFHVSENSKFVRCFGAVLIMLRSFIFANCMAFLFKYCCHHKISFSQSYGQYMLFPYGHTGEHVENYEELVRFKFKTFKTKLKIISLFQYDIANKVSTENQIK